ncbi:formin-like protein 7 [Oryza glaberrima]|uniref:formin-like protein 7 n=1 Tax=Oryza glaberrima TaxID=4538 RepID=UPI00224C485B|nr:formin-like protein 7 [Oryza glaberrima]
MSTSANPSAAPLAEYAEHLSNLVAIPSLSHENHYFLGPVGSLDPTEFINDPSIEQVLDEEEIEEDIDQAAAEMSDTERTPSASPEQTPPTPSAPTHFSRKKKTAVRKKSAAPTLKPAPPPPPPPSPLVQRESSNRTPSAADSHNVEEEEQSAAPVIPVLADLFSFDIKDYLDEIEEDTTSKAVAPLSDDVKRMLEDISHRLEASLDNLVTNCGSIRARFTDIQALLPDELTDARFTDTLSNTNSSWRRPSRD